MTFRFAVVGGRAAAVGALFCASQASAVEYPLQFTPSGNYEDLVVAGYGFANSSVVGNCSNTRITSGSGRDPRPVYTPVPQTCTWDLYGRLLGAVSGAPAIPAPIGTSGTETIYAEQSSEVYTGSDSALPNGGFVFTFGSHYRWLTPNTYLVLAQGSYTFSAVLTSDGDMPLTVSSVKVTNVLKQAKVTLDSSTCLGQIQVGGTCSVTVTYKDTRLSSTTGLAYDTLTIHLESDAGQTNDFVQSYTDEVRVPRDPP